MSKSQSGTKPRAIHRNRVIIISRSSPSLTQQSFSIAPGEALFFWTIGPPQDAGGAPRPTLILLHGLRDVGRSLLPVAAELAEHYFCVMPDLRGHGKSFRPGSYAMPHFLMDLHRLLEHLGVERISLFGHSLGGHIVCRYAGLYPKRVANLIVVEGLGPPLEEMQKQDEMARVAMQFEQAIATAEQASTPRELANVEVAAERLQKNNPGLSAERALQLAQWGTRPSNPASVADQAPADQSPNIGPVVWAFDPRAQEVFLSVSNQRNLEFWRAIKARTLVVTGDLGHLYWRATFASDGYSGLTSASELSARLAALGSPEQPAEHLQISNAGHQVHYDQPDALAAATKKFLLAQ